MKKSGQTMFKQLSKIGLTSKKIGKDGRKFVENGFTAKWHEKECSKNAPKMTTWLQKFQATQMTTAQPRDIIKGCTDRIQTIYLH